MLWRAALVLVALVLGAGTACGGGDEESSSAPPPPAEPPAAEPPAAEPPGTTGTLQGVVWEWQGSQYSDDTEAVPEDPSRYTIEFADDGTATIQADCNQVRADYVANEDDSTLSITPGASTKVACPEDSLDSEFMRDLEGAAIYFFDDAGDLLIDIKFDSGTMRFSPSG